MLKTNWGGGGIGDIGHRQKDMEGRGNGSEDKQGRKGMEGTKVER